MRQENEFNQVFQTFHAIGKAIGRVNGNNTHSGNLSMRHPQDPDRFYATASGSQIGGLIPQDIVPLHFTQVGWGDGRATTESNIHRQVLGLPGVNACIHCHHLMSTAITFDSRDSRIFLRYPDGEAHELEDAVFQPVDIHGANIIGSVKVGTFRQPVGSIEMEERIPRYLADASLTLVRGHGLFAAGPSMETCLKYVSVLENSATLALNLARLDVALGPIQDRLLTGGADAVFPRYSGLEKHRPAPDGQRISNATTAEFAHWLAYNYNIMIGAYGTGSMSRKVTSREMIYCPMSAVPRGMPVPLYRTSIDITGEDDFEIALHKLIYQHSTFTTCMMAANPLITAEAMAILAKRYGTGVLTGDPIDSPYTQADHPVIVPIDAEAIYLNPRLGLVDSGRLDDRTARNPILNMLKWHKGLCVVAGFGVIATGDTTLEQTAHNISSAERIAKFRTEVYLNRKLLNGPAVEAFEPKTI